MEKRRKNRDDYFLGRVLLFGKSELATASLRPDWQYPWTMWNTLINLFMSIRLFRGHKFKILCSF